MVENVARLYERGAPTERIEAYFQRWTQWVKGGISAKLLRVIWSGRAQGDLVSEFFGRALSETVRGHSGL